MHKKLIISQQLLTRPIREIFSLFATNWKYSCRYTDAYSLPKQ